MSHPVRRGYVPALAVVVAAAAVALAAVDLADAGELIEGAPERLGGGAYPFAGAMGFLELTLLGLPLPFEVGVVLSGAVAGEGEISFLPLVAVVWVSAAAGESLNFWLGRRFGRPFALRHGPRVRLTARRLARVEGHFERHGAATVVAGRFIPLMRSTVPFVAGSSLMRYPRFAAASVGGCGLWAAAFAGLGYAFDRNADEIAELVGSVGLIALGLLAAAAVAAYLLRRRRRPRAAQDSA